MGEVLDLEAYRARPQELLVTPEGAWVALRVPLRPPVFLGPREARDVADLLQLARTLQSFGPREAHGVAVASLDRQVTIQTTATGELTLSRRAALSLTMALAKAAAGGTR